MRNYNKANFCWLVYAHVFLHEFPEPGSVSETFTITPVQIISNSPLENVNSLTVYIGEFCHLIF